MIDLNSIKCNGCHSCSNACPEKCINMQPDIEGFLYPIIDLDKCINCHICEKVCPLTTHVGYSCDTKAYAAYNKNLKVRLNSSSGGIFSLLATEIINDGGVVFGAAFDNDFQVHHIAVYNTGDLKKLYGSKYVQSRIGKTYSQAKKYLDDGKSVLFSGTPCQIGGLKSFLRKDYDNLYTQDIICHGVPAPKLWKKYLSSISDGESVKSVCFRNKDNGWSNYQIKIKFDSHSFKSKFTENKYIKMFLRNICLRDSCYNCEFKTLDRPSDITLADFWGINDVCPEMYDVNGTSLLLIHTEKGKNLFNQISDKIEYEATDLKKAIENNLSAIQSSVPHKKRKKYLSKIDSLDFDKLYNCSLIPKKSELLRGQIVNKLRSILK